MSFLLHLLRPDDLFVDVGANIGSYTILASAVCGARSIAVEPDPTSARALRRNIDANGIGSRVDVVQAAAGAKSGTLSFTVGHDTTNHVTTDDESNTQKVRVETLDGIVGAAEPTLIKVDVEGYESEVISGAPACLNKPSLIAIILETVDRDVRSVMSERGFVPVVYEPFARRVVFADTTERPAVSANTLFIRPELIQRRLRGSPYRRVAGLRI